MRRLLTHLLRTPLPLLRTPSSIKTHSPIPLLYRSLHGQSPPFQSPNSLPPSRILQQIPTQSAAPDDEDAAMNEFLSRFVWAIRGKLTEAYPGLTRETLDDMLLVICQKVVEQMDQPSSAATAADPAADLSEDLWKTIWEVSKSVHEAMRRDRMREELKKYLHCDEVKEMCRFAGDAGIRGDLLRELRFKWAREKLEEVEFYRDLEKMREEAKKQEQEKMLYLEPGDQVSETEPFTQVEGESYGKGKVAALPQRKGKIKYKIYGLDLSAPEWEEVAKKVDEAEKLIVDEEPQPIVGRCKVVDDKVLALNPTEDDPLLVLAEWKQAVEPKRVDWLALLERIKQKNVKLYFKVAEQLLTEDSLETNIRDYSKLIDAHFKANRIEDAERILNKMIEAGIEPDIITSIILVHMYSKIGNVERTKDAFESLRNQGFQPDLKIYMSMIMAYVKAGLTKQGETLTREMEAKGINPTKEVYMDLLRAYAERGQVDGAQRMVNSMQFAGFQPTLESSTLLVEAYGRAGHPDEARGHFDQMMKAGHKPDDRCAASMISAYAKKNLLDKALDLLLTLEKNGFKPGVATHTALVDWWGRLQLAEEAERQVEKIAELGEGIPLEIHVILCDMYSRAGIEEKARKSLNILEARKRLLSSDQFERIVSGLLAGGFMGDAKRMYNVMQELQVPVSEPLRVAFMAAQSIPQHSAGKRRRGPRM